MWYYLSTMARPALPAAVRKSDTIKVRLIPSVRKAVKQRARIGGQTESRWLRELIASAVGQKNERK